MTWIAKLATIGFVLLSQVQWGGSWKESLSASLVNFVPEEQTLVSEAAKRSASVVEAPLVVSPPIKEETPAPGAMAEAVAVYDFNTLVPLYEKEATAVRAVGSLAKLMTAELALEKLSLDDRVEMSVKAVNTPYSELGAKAGEEFTVDSLLRALLISSSNDAAVALAEKMGNGSVDFFMDQVNARAELLGLEQTHFKNPAGLDEDEGQESSARDVAVMLRQLYLFPRAREIMTMKDAKISNIEGREIELKTTDDLLSDDSVGKILAGKTGTTDAAGQCLAVIVELDNGGKVVVVVLGSADRFGDTRKVIKNIKESYKF